MEIKNKHYGTPRYRSLMMAKWKSRGVIHDDFKTLFEEYINTTHCQQCSTPFKSTQDRHVDHAHETGLFRAIICHKCNVNDSYIKYPYGYDAKEWRKEYIKQNKEHIKEKNKKYYEKNKEYAKEYYQNGKVKCDCGIDTNKHQLARHKRTMKHMDWYMNSVD